jgi:hypothetical protein
VILASVFVGYPLLMAMIALFVRFVRPGWRTMRIVLVANVPLPACMLAAAGIGVASLGPARPSEIDATGMAIAVYMMGGMFVAFWMVVLGIPAAWVALRWTRPGG